MVKGAGTAAIESIVRESMRSNTRGGRVKLSALPTAVSFYEKIGFTVSNKKASGLIDMELTPESAARFIEVRDKARQPDFTEMSVEAAIALNQEIEDLEQEAMGAFAISEEKYRPEQENFDG
jgi:hypothetical protein